MGSKYNKPDFSGLLTMSQKEYEQKNSKQELLGKSSVTPQEEYEQKSLKQDSLDKNSITNQNGFIQKSFYITKSQDSAILLKIARTDRKMDRSTVVREALNSYLADILATIDSGENEN